MIHVTQFSVVGRTAGTVVFRREYHDETLLWGGVGEGEGN